jgi:hypothetical protein
MCEVKRLDLGADIVLLPERNLIVLHPDLDYAQSLGAIMGTLPGIHPDAARCLVEKVTSRTWVAPRGRLGRTWDRVRIVVVAAVLAVAIAVWSTPQTASAHARFGQSWSDAVHRLGLTCQGSSSTERSCVTPAGKPVRIHGYRHEFGSVYVVTGATTAIIFVFDDPSNADDYARLHPGAKLIGNTVIW